MTPADAQPDAQPEARTEKRGNVREPARRPVRLSLPAAELKGLTRDVSASGAFVISAQDLPVEVEIGDGEARPAKVVRLELLPGGGIGLALEFDPPRA